MEHGVLGAVRAELDRDDERTRLPFGFVERRDQRRTPAVEQRFPFEVEQFAGDRRRFAERAAGSAHQQHPALPVGFVGVGDVPGDHTCTGALEGPRIERDFFGFTGGPCGFEALQRFTAVGLEFRPGAPAPVGVANHLPGARAFAVAVADAPNGVGRFFGRGAEHRDIGRRDRVIGLRRRRTRGLRSGGRGRT